MISLTFFNENARIYSPVPRSLRKMNAAEKNDYASQLCDYVILRSETVSGL